MGYIYIVLVKAHTLLGRMARLTDPYEYTHIALCPNEKLEHFYTFSRARHYTPFISGFMRETMDCYAYGRYKSVKLKIFKIPVSARQKAAVTDFVKETYLLRKEYCFNLYSALTMKAFHGISIPGAMNCMSFIGEVLRLSGAVPMDRPSNKYTIREMDELMTPYFLAEGEYTPKRVDSLHYMDPVNPLANIGSFVALNAKLIHRILGKKIHGK